MSGKHANISVFVPHIGCPHICSFCNQCHITGSRNLPDETDVVNAVNTAVLSKGYNPQITEIAFFGGSFTAIEREYMVSLLEAAYPYVEDGTVRGIRISTRPDAIDEEILEILKSYGVTSIELGAQSLDDRVLEANRRGHTSLDVKNASKLIKEYGFSLGLQMMTGLYGDTDSGSVKTAQGIIALKPDTVRIYPTVVLKDTSLAVLYEKGEYKPQTVESAVKLCAELYLMFEENGISVIRLGLHTIERDSYVAGAWHPAFSQLCQSEIYYKKIRSALNLAGDYTVFVNPSCISSAIGQKRSNILRLENDGFRCKIKPKEKLAKFEIYAERSR